MRKVIFITFVLAFAAGIFAQEKPTAKWTRIEFEDKKFAISFPPNFIVDTEKRGSRRYKVFGFLDGVKMVFQVSKFENTKGSLAGVQFSDNEALSRFSMNGFDGRRATASTSNIYSERIIIASEDYYYYIGAFAKSSEAAVLKRFLFSVHLGGKQLFTQKEKPQLEEETVQLDTLKTSPEVTEATSRKYVENRANVSYELMPVEIESDPNNEQFSRAVIIVEQPYNLKPIAGVGVFTAKLKINFLASGQIGDIIVYSGNREFGEACAKAARKIKFIPAQIAGKNVDATAVVEYTILTPGY